MNQKNIPIYHIKTMTTLKSLQPELYDFIYKTVIEITNKFNDDIEEQIHLCFRKEFTYMFDEDETKFPLTNKSNILKYLKENSFNMYDKEDWEIRDTLAYCLAIDIFYELP